jgi:ATP-dependent Lon protease
MGLRIAVLPKDNEKDLADIPQEILSALTLHFVETMDEVLQIALERPIVPLEQLPVVVPVVADAPGADAFLAGAEKDTSLTN